MNTKNNYKASRGLALTACICALSMLIAACASPLASGIPASGDSFSGGTLSVSINGGGISARTLLPTAPVFTKYVVQFSGPAPVSDKEITDAFLDSITLAAGSWTIKAIGYAKFKGVDYAVAEGSSTVTVVDGVPAKVDIAISSITSGANGDFTYDIVVPQGLKATSCAISLKPYVVGTGDAGTAIVDDALGDFTVDASSADWPKSGTVSCAPGYYLFNVALSGDCSTATRTELVRVYPNMATTGAFAFSATDFVPVITLSGTANLKINTATQTEVSVGAFTDPKDPYGSTIGTVTTGTGVAWTMDIQALKAPTTVYFSLAKLDGSSYVFRYCAQTITVFDQDISNITFTEDASRVTLSGTFALSKDGIAQAPETMDIYVSTGSKNSLTGGSFVSDASGAWTLNVDAVDQDTPIYFEVNSPNHGNMIYIGPSLMFKDANIPNIALALNIRTLSGSVSMSLNDAPVSAEGWFVELNSAEVPTMADTRYDYTNSSSTGTWTLLTGGLVEGNTLYMHLSKTIDGTYYSEVIPYTVPAGDAAITGIALDMVKKTVAVSGSLAVGSSGVTIDPARWGVFASTEDPATVSDVWGAYTRAIGFSRLVDNAGSLTWSMPVDKLTTGSRDVWIWAISAAGEGVILDAYSIKMPIPVAQSAIPGQTLVLSDMRKYGYTVSGSLSGASGLDLSMCSMYALSTTDIQQATIYGLAMFNAAGQWSMSFSPYATAKNVYFLLYDTKNRIYYMMTYPVNISPGDHSDINLLLSDMEVTSVS